MEISETTLGIACIAAEDLAIDWNWDDVCPVNELGGEAGTGGEGGYGG